MKKKKTKKKKLYVHVQVSNDGKNWINIIKNTPLEDEPIIFNVSQICFASMRLVKGKKIKTPKKLLELEGADE